MANPTDSQTLKDLVLGDLEHELTTTRRVLERVPEEHLAWKPHEKSMTLGGLAFHVANLPSWGRLILEEDVFDVGAPIPRQSPPASRQEIVDLFDERAAAFRSALERTTDERLVAPWTLKHGEHVIESGRRAVMLRRLALSHLIHHRGQLGVYFRLVGVPVPGMYGPSADEGRG